MQSMIDQADDDHLLHEMKARKGELVAQKCLIYSNSEQRTVNWIKDL